MTTPRRQRGLGGADPLDELVPGAATVTHTEPAPTPRRAIANAAARTEQRAAGPGSKTQITVYLPADIADGARNAVAALGDAEGDPDSLSDLVATAVAAEVERLQQSRNGGKSFPARRRQKLTPGNR